MLPGNAKIDGLQKDLKMTNNQYNITLTIFFISYALFEPLTNILLKRLRPSIFIPAIMVAWGESIRRAYVTSRLADKAAQASSWSSWASARTLPAWQLLYVASSLHLPG